MAEEDAPAAHAHAGAVSWVKKHWVWIAVGAGVVVVYLWYKHASGGGSSQTVIPTSGSLGYSSGGVGSGGYSPGSTGTGTSGTGSTASSGLPFATTTTGIGLMPHITRAPVSSLPAPTTTPSTPRTSAALTTALNPTIAAFHWVHIPTPTVGSALASSGVNWATVGNAQYANSSQLKEISKPSQGFSLLKSGYNIFAIGGHEYYRPSQTPKPGKAVYASGNTAVYANGQAA